MDINSVSEVTVSAGYEFHPPPVSKPPQKVAPEPAKADVSVAEQQDRSKEHAQKMVEEIQKHLSNLDVSLTFSTYGENNNQVSIVVAERATGKVIREIPSKELQSLYTKMQELAGMILNKRA